MHHPGRREGSQLKRRIYRGTQHLRPRRGVTACKQRKGILFLSSELPLHLSGAAGEPLGEPAAPPLRDPDTLTGAESEGELGERPAGLAVRRGLSL